MTRREWVMTWAWDALGWAIAEGTLRNALNCITLIEDNQ
jgi:hypothetical protein